MEESSTLIDAICTNKPQNISDVDITASLSDHEMIACVRKINNHPFLLVLLKRETTTDIIMNSFVLIFINLVLTQYIHQQRLN